MKRTCLVRAAGTDRVGGVTHVLRVLAKGVVGPCCSGCAGKVRGVQLYCTSGYSWGGITLGCCTLEAVTAMPAGSS